MRKKRLKYKKEFPRILYTYFVTYKDTSSAPSFSKFARSIGGTLEDIESFRKNAEFDEAYRECSEIRRDYLIDSALCRRFDPSFTKFLLSLEYPESKDSDEACEMKVTLEVLGGDGE